MAFLAGAAPWLSGVFSGAASSMGAGAATSGIIGSLGSQAAMGAALGGAMSALSGGDVGRGALNGALGGALMGGVGQLFGAGATGAIGANGMETAMVEPGTSMIGADGVLSFPTTTVPEIGSSYTDLVRDALQQTGRSMVMSPQPRKTRQTVYGPNIAAPQQLTMNPSANDVDWMDFEWMS